MITKAIIQEKRDNKFKVRIPLFESAGNLQQIILDATLCYQPGNLEAYNVNDVVYVAFENGTPNNPVIIGKLYLGKEDNPRGVILTSGINVSTKAVLPTDTSIGNIKADDVYAALKNDQIQDDKIKQLEEKLNDILNYLNNN